MYEPVLLRCYWGAAGALLVLGKFRSRASTN